MKIEIRRTNTRKFEIYRCYWFCKRPLTTKYNQNLDKWVPQTYRSLEEAQLALRTHLDNLIYVKKYEDVIQKIKIK